MKQVSRFKASGGNRLRLDLFLPYRLSALAGRTSRLLSSVYESRFGISIPEWRVIAHVAAHDALKTTTLRRSDHVHLGDVLENVDRDRVAGVDLVVTENGEFAQHASRRNAGLLVMSLRRLVRALRRLFQG